MVKLSTMPNAENSISKEPIGLKQLYFTFMQDLMKHYHGPLWAYLQKHQELKENFTAFLLQPEKIITYFSSTHIGIEYLGPEFVSEIKGNGQMIGEVRDYSTEEGNILEKIVGFKYRPQLDKDMDLPLLNFTENLVLPTNKGLDKLLDLKWNFTALQDGLILPINAPCPTIRKNQFARLINCFFFDADETGLKTRHIKWLDLIPIEFDNTDPEMDKFIWEPGFMEQFIKADAEYIYPLPEGYKYEKLPKINRFIEIWGSDMNSEVDITKFLAKEENNFILTMRFGVKDIYPELICEWQSDKEREPIKPDFFLLNSDGYADIVEFKKPNIKNNSIVGKINRETFSAEINSYIAQTRVYEEYFDDPNNRKWFKERYGFNVHKPKRKLIVGRRYNFESEVWREIVADYRNIEIMNFDDLVDGVVVQFYK